MCSNADGGVRTALSRKPGAHPSGGHMMGQTDGQTQDHVICCAPYRPTIKAISVIEEKSFGHIQE